MRIALAAGATLAGAGCAVTVHVPPHTADVIGGAVLLGVMASDLRDARPAPQLTPDRRIAVVDCTRPLPDPLPAGNLRCAPRADR